MQIGNGERDMTITARWSVRVGGGLWQKREQVDLLARAERKPGSRIAKVGPLALSEAQDLAVEPKRARQIAHQEARMGELRESHKYSHLPRDIEKSRISHKTAPLTRSSDTGAALKDKTLDSLNTSPWRTEGPQAQGFAVGGALLRAGPYAQRPSSLLTHGVPELSRRLI